MNTAVLHSGECCAVMCALVETTQKEIGYYYFQLKTKSNFSLLKL